MRRFPLKSALKGMSTYIPGLYGSTDKGGGETDSARYCYAVWLRHVVSAAENGLWNWPATVAELGPGGSLGVGLTALLTGSSSYYALDAVPYAASPQHHLLMLCQLTSMLRDQEPIPDDDEFPRLLPRLKTYGFPAHLLGAAVLEEGLSRARIDSIRTVLTRPEYGSEAGIKITYHAPWGDPGTIETGSVDMVLSQAVLEHVDDLEKTYHALSTWLKPEGLMSHTIDFSSHGIVDSWNGHWAIPRPFWRLVRGRRPFLLNRCSWSEHRGILGEYGFDVIFEDLTHDESGMGRRSLARGRRAISDVDLATRAAFFQARKQGNVHAGS